ncbi:hypothetical protein ACHAWF_011218 [Thalassiosira exigua]
MDQSCESPPPGGFLNDDCGDPQHHDAQHGGVADTKLERTFLDSIIVGYAFGPKKMETMGLIMAEASKALSTVECSGELSSVINKNKQQGRKLSEHMGLTEDSSMATATTAAASMFTSHCSGESSGDVEKESSLRGHYFSDNEEDTRSLSSTYTRASFPSLRSQRGLNGNNGVNPIQLTFLHSNGFIHLVRSASTGGGAGEGESITGSSVTTTATNLVSFRKQGLQSATCSSPMPLSLSSSLSKEMNEPSQSSLGYAAGKQKNCQHSARRSKGSSTNVQRHPIRVSFVPIDLDTPLEEQHGGEFDVILHKMTEDILSISKMLRAQDIDREGDGRVDVMSGSENGHGQPPSGPMITHPVDSSNLFETNSSMTRHQARASRRIQRLREYKQKVRPSCVLVDSPDNILAVMSRADMAEVLSRCLAGVTTKAGIPVGTPRFRVVDEDADLEGENDGGPMRTRRGFILADEIDSSGFKYPLIAKPLTAAGTKSSHHMGIVLARDGLQRLKTPCILQEYANHGEKLFKVYVLGESVWVFSRESLPNLPMGEKQVEDGDVCRMRGEHALEGYSWLWSQNKRPRTESYVEFERPAGSRCYVEFNSQRPYPKLSDFGIVSDEGVALSKDQSTLDWTHSPENKKQRVQSYYETNPRKSLSPTTNIGDINLNQNSDLSSFVTADEIEPVTTALREAFGLELFGFDVLVKHDQNNSHDTEAAKEILVVDVNYFPGYKEVPNFPSLLAQYLTQKAVENRMKSFVEAVDK